MSDNKKSCNKFKIGGQAVIEGVMMRGNTSQAIAVRDSSGQIRLETTRQTKKKGFWHKVPVVRGVLNFVASMKDGVSTLTKSADVFGESEEPTRFEKWVSEKLKIDLMAVVTFFALILGLGLAIGLFIILPSFLSSLLKDALNLSNIWRNVVEGGIKLLLFISYILLTSLVKDVKRVYRYHGAEHKTINAYENGLELTVENVRNSKKFHNRCGTTFIFFVLLVSIILFSFLNFGDQEVLRAVVKILSLPLVAGLSYELLIFLAKKDWWILYPLRIPGILMQKITTKEPDDKMIEVAILSFKSVLEMELDPEVLPKDNLNFKYFKDLKKELKSEKIKENPSDLEWIVARVLKIKRSEIFPLLKIKKADEKAILHLVKECEKAPLQYVFGDTNFCGINLKVDERALIPRFETEELVSNVLKHAEGKKTLLDLCTGSGAIAISAKLNSHLEVTASDKSEDALSLAKENAQLNNAQITFLKMDMFENLQGKFDMIVSNPPYIPTKDLSGLDDEVKKEPQMALDGGEDGLDFYREIGKRAKDFLTENGMLFLEVGISQSHEVSALLEEDFQVEIVQDIYGVNRIIIGKLRKINL